MNLPAGLAVAVAILVLFPLAAVAVGRRWRDPPRERWGIPPETLAAAANTPELVAYRRRIALGITDPRVEAVVHRAIRTGTVAPPELRAATRELAALRIDELDRRVRTNRVVFGMWLASPLSFSAPSATSRWSTTRAGSCCSTACTGGSGRT